MVLGLLITLLGVLSFILGYCFGSMREIRKEEKRNSNYTF